MVSQDIPELLPLFPLPDHVALPFVPMPYHVFEPRYQALVRELIARPEEERWLAIPRLQPGWEEDYEGSPPIYATATAGRIIRVVPVEEGRYDIIVLGLARCTLDEAPTPTPYRMAVPTALLEPIPPTDDAELATMWRTIGGIQHAALEVVRVVGTHGKALAGAVTDPAEVNAWLFRLAAAVIQDSDKRYAFLETSDLDERMRFMLDTFAGLLALVSRNRPDGKTKLRS